MVELENVSVEVWISWDVDVPLVEYHSVILFPLTSMDPLGVQLLKGFDNWLVKVCCAFDAVEQVCFGAFDKCAFVPSSWYWDSTVPVAKLEASHSRRNFLWSEGKVRTGVEVTADFKVSKVLCCAGPQDQI